MAKNRRSTQKSNQSKNEQRYLDIIGTMSNWVWETDKNHRYTFMSDQLFKETNLKPEDVYGKTRPEIAALAEWVTEPKDLERQKKLMDREESFTNFEFSRHQKNGKIQYFRSTGRPFYADDGEFLGYRGATINITEQKVTETALRLSEDRFRDFTLSAVDRFWETDENHKYIYLSPPTSRFKALPESFIGKELWHNLEGRTDLETLDKLKSITGKCETFHDVHTSWRGLDGDMRYAQLNGIATFDHDGKFRGYRGTTIDETDAVAARVEADEFRQNFMEAVDSISEGFVIWDENDRFVTCNTQYKNWIIVEIGKELVPGMAFEEYLYLRAESGSVEDAVGREKEWVAGVMAGRDRDRTEIQRAGRWFVIRRHRLPNGGTIEFHGDITELKTREVEFELAKVEAESANRTKTEFLANMSHELRSPLTAILGFTESMQEEIFGPIGNPKYKEYLDAIYRSGHHLHEIINDILDISAVEAGRLHLTQTKMNIDDVVDSAIHMVRVRTYKKTLDFNSRVSPDIPEFFGDDRRIKQILVNLLSNAYKFTGEGGKVNLVVDIIEDGRLMFSLTDTGIGMDDDGIEKAMATFGQVDSQLSREYEGTGLGLPLTAGLVAAHDGTMEIESAPGVGTTVRVYFPAERLG